MSESLTLGERLDRLPLSRRHFGIAAIVGVGILFDFYEVFLAGTLSSVLQREFEVSDTSLKLILASAFIGMFFGAAFFGRLADRIGRRRSMLISTSFGVIWAFALFPLADTGSPVLMGLGISATLFFVGISSSTMTAFMPELFRTAYRSTGTGAAFNLGSAVGASVPSIIAAPLLAAFGGIGVAVMLSAFAFAATVSVAFLNETRGRSLDDTATKTAARPAADAV